MAELKYTIRRLDSKEHNKTSFNCGIQELDRYFTEQAGQDMRRHIAVTYVLNELSSNDIIGYHTLSATSIELKNLSEQEIKKLPRYPLLPATLIGRLAIDTKYQGQGMGQLLLIHALKISLETSRNVASLAVIVDAKNDKAAQFYQHFGFIQFSDKADKLFLPLETIRKMNFND
jgi:predicted GNAT family N-acyltransferase